MRTFVAGLESLRRTPAAVLPLSAAGAAGAVAVWVGAMPSGGAGAAATAAFPMDLFFDLKQAIARAPSWPWFVVFVAISLVVRSGLLAATWWLAMEPDARPDPRTAFEKAGGLSLRAVVWLFPGAGLFFIGTATRYTPFIVLAAVVSVWPAAKLLARAAHLNIASGPSPEPGPFPGLSQLLGYGYLIAVQGALMSVLIPAGRWAAGLFVLLMGPVHGTILLGFRETARVGAPRSRAVLAITGIVVVLIASDVFLDRSLRTPGPAVSTDAPGSLLLLSGVDSTSEQGSMFGFDPRAVGFPVGDAMLLSYRGPGRTYTAADTRGDLDDAAEAIAHQVADVRAPRLVLGHSQASPIIDRMIADNRALPEGAAVFSPSPSYPSPLSIPPPDDTGEGKVGGDVARAFARLLDTFGATPYDVDAPASPTNLDEIVIPESPLPRLSVWALADSVWLSGDWRHAGHVNVVALSDHVGTLNDPAAIGAVRRFFAGEQLQGDERSLKGVLAVTLRYAFEPWRPR